MTSGCDNMTCAHTHECRDCGASIWCDGVCVWDGGNDGCDCAGEIQEPSAAQERAWDEQYDGTSLGS